MALCVAECAWTLSRGQLQWQLKQPLQADGKYPWVHAVYRLYPGPSAVGVQGQMQLGYLWLWPAPQQGTAMCRWGTQTVYDPRVQHLHWLYLDSPLDVHWQSYLARVHHVHIWGSTQCTKPTWEPIPIVLHQPWAITRLKTQTQYMDSIHDSPDLASHVMSLWDRMHCITPTLYKHIMSICEVSPFYLNPCFHSQPCTANWALVLVSPIPISNTPLKPQCLQIRKKTHPHIAPHVHRAATHASCAQGRSGITEFERKWPSAHHQRGESSVCLTESTTHYHPATLTCIRSARGLLCSSMSRTSGSRWDMFGE